MFTGIVTELGEVVAVDHTLRGRSIRIDAVETVKDLAVGDSIAVNGVCLTVVRTHDQGFEVEAVTETLERSAIGLLVSGDRVNLERPLTAAGRLDGHIVQGHIDGIGTILERTPDSAGERVRIGIPRSLAPYLVEKGSVTVDGVSLTVTAVASLSASDAWFEIALIPHTLDVTVLGSHRPQGSAVNIEVDVLAKYVERMMEART